MGTMETETHQQMHLPDCDDLEEFFAEYEWIHLTLGVIGNMLFFSGSILFLFEDQLQTVGIWAFIVGSFLMLVGSVGNALVKYVRDRW